MSLLGRIEGDGSKETLSRYGAGGKSAGRARSGAVAEIQMRGVDDVFGLSNLTLY